MADEQESVPLPKLVVEYPLPASSQTHEMAAVGDNMLVVTQQPSSSLLKIQLDSVTGRPTSAAQFTIGGSSWAGLHGLFRSSQYPGQVWATLQFQSALVRLDPVVDELNSPPQVVQRIPLPTSSVWGPHVIIEHGNDLWTTCKDSGHLVRVSHIDPSDISIYKCKPRPIFVAVHPTSGEVYASLDESSKIFRLLPDSGASSEIDIPSSKGSTPVGLVAGPDGNVWFVLLGGSDGGTGTFGCILESGEITWFELPSSTAGASAGLIHLAFDKNNEDDGALRIWLLGSSLSSHSSIDAIFTVYLQGDTTRHIERVDSVYLPTPYCGTHRVLPHRGGLFVTELETSILAHVKGSAITGSITSETLDSYSLWGLGIASSQIVYLNDQEELQEDRKLSTVAQKASKRKRV